MNPFHGVQPGEECLGTIMAFGLDTKRLIANGLVRRGEKDVTIHVREGDKVKERTVRVETYYYTPVYLGYRKEPQP